MTKQCSYCNVVFTASRKDKRYCSNSCKQMAFIKRQAASIGLIPTKLKNVNNQEDETSNGQNVKPSSQDIDVLEAGTVKNEAVPSILNEAAVYVPVKCKWLDSLYDWVYVRGNDEKLSSLTTSYNDKAQQVKWVSTHYRCLLTSVLTVSDMKTVEWTDLAELTNAFTFLIATPYFQELPDDYPFTKEIVRLKDKLRVFCIESQNEEHVQLKLKFDTKKELLLQRYEMSMFPKITFNQLQMDFKTENEKYVKKQEEEQEREKQLKEERPWQKRWREMNMK